MAETVIFVYLVDTTLDCPRKKRNPANAIERVLLAL